MRKAWNECFGRFLQHKGKLGLLSKLHKKGKRSDNFSVMY